MGIREARRLAREYARDEMGWEDAEHVGEIPAGAGEVHVFRLPNDELLGLGVEPGAWGEEEVPVWDEDAEPECDLCLDRGEWISEDGLVEPCPACVDREEVK